MRVSLSWARFRHVALGGVLGWVLLAGTAGLAHAESPPTGAVPFPVNKTTVVRAKDGPVYFIDGPTVIPRTVEITVQLKVRIIGINGASLDVQGGLKVHGTQDFWVEIRNVDFSPTLAPKKGLHLDMVNLFGCRFVHGEGAGLRGDVVIENAAMQRDCAFDVRLIEGSLKLMTIDSGIDWKIRCEPPDLRRPKIELQVRTNWARVVHLTGPCDATFRHNEFRGGLICRQVAAVIVDGCDVVTGSLAFHQGARGSFKKIKLTKCNLYTGSTIILDREANPDAKKEKVKIDKCYFGPKAGAGKVILKAKNLGALIDDGADVEHRRVFASIGKLQKRRHRLVDYDQLRLRVPKVQ